MYREEDSHYESIDNVNNSELWKQGKVIISPLRDRPLSDSPNFLDMLFLSFVGKSILPSTYPGVFLGRVFVCSLRAISTLARWQELKVS